MTISANSLFRRALVAAEVPAATAPIIRIFIIPPMFSTIISKSQPVSNKFAIIGPLAEAMIQIKAAIFHIDNTLIERAEPPMPHEV